MMMMKMHKSVESRMDMMQQMMEQMMEHETPSRRWNAVAEAAQQSHGWHSILKPSLANARVVLKNAGYCWRQNCAKLSYRA
jgi:hypothetical protein